MVVKLPANWREIAVAEFYQVDYSDMDKTRFELMLKKVMKISVRLRNPNWNDQLDWLENAEREHVKLPFQRILAKENPRSNNAVICESDLLDGRIEIKHPPSEEVGKKAERLMQVISPMLRCSHRILLVDPYFAIDNKKNTKLLELFKEEFSLYGICPSVEIHIPRRMSKLPEWDEFYSII